MIMLIKIWPQPSFAVLPQLRLVFSPNTRARIPESQILIEIASSTLLNDDFHHCDVTEIVQLAVDLSCWFYIVRRDVHAK